MKGVFAAVLLASSQAGSGPDAARDAGAAVFNGRVLAVADADMAATAYADGRLEPLPGPAGEDALLLVAERDGRLVQLDRVFASNSVISWPQIVEAAPGLALVAETRAPAPDGVERMESVYDDFPSGRHVAAFRVGTDRIDPAGRAEAGLNPQSVSLSPDRRWALVATEAPDAEAVFLALGPDGFLDGPGAVRRIDLDPPDREGGEGRLRGLFWSPDGALAAANVENERLVFYRVIRDADGDPAGLEPAGPPVEIGSRWSVGTWTPDARWFLATDTGWGSGRGLDMLFNRRGVLTSVGRDADDAPVVADRLRTGLSPEGLDVSPDGRLAVTVNMGRTYLPEIWPLAVWPGRGRSSLTLVEIDAETGALTRAGRNVAFEGVLPEDAVFDADGDSLMVATFHLRRGEGRERGFVDLWRIVSTPDGPRLVFTGARLATVRGPHDLARLP